MLKKLMKYELLAALRKMLTWYIVFAVSSIIVAFLPKFLSENFDKITAQAINELFYLIYIGIVYITVFSPLYFTSVVYSKAMFGDEAHLIRTFPVKERQFVISHTIVSALLLIANLVIVSLFLTFSLTKDYSVSMISAEFVDGIMNVLYDMARNPMVIAVLICFVTAGILLIISTSLLIMYIKNCFEKKDMLPKLVIMALSAVLFVVLLVLFSDEDLFYCFILWIPIFVLTSVIEMIFVMRINRKEYNLL